MMLSIKEKIYRALLVSLKGGSVAELSELKKLTHLDIEVLVSYLPKDFLKLVEDRIMIINKVALALEMVNSGIHIEDVLLNLGWRDFEDFCAELLREQGFKITRNFKFRHSLERYEIDVLAYRHPYLLSIDCKRVRKLSNYFLKSVAEKQLRRTEALSMELWRHYRKLGIERCKPIMLIPAVFVVASMNPRIYGGVPVVPIGKVLSFVKEFEQLVNDFLRVIESKPPKVAKF